MTHRETAHILAINWQDISHPLGGGAEVHLHEISKRLVQHGCQVTVLCSRYRDSAAEEEIDGVAIVRRSSRAAFNFAVPHAYRQLRRCCAFDLVIDDINKIPFYTPLYVREPILALVHHLFQKSIFLQAAWPAAAYVYSAEKWIPRVYRHTPFAAVSESTRSELRSLGIQTEIDLLPNGVDLDSYTVRQELRPAKPTIGYIGRLKKYKSIDHFLRAIPAVAAEVPDLRAVIVGDGDDRDRLQRLTVELGLQDRVEFAGFVTQTEKVERLNQLWLAVNPSSKEGWGLTVIEANACGVPVVAADSPGLRDSVVHEKTGLLYAYGDVTALSRQILFLLNRQQRRREMAHLARQWAERFSWDASAGIAQKIIERILVKNKHS